VAHVLIWPGGDDVMATLLLYAHVLREELVHRHPPEEEQIPQHHGHDPRELQPERNLWRPAISLIQPRNDERAEHDHTHDGVQDLVPALDALPDMEPLVDDLRVDPPEHRQVDHQADSHNTEQHPRHHPVQAACQQAEQRPQDHQRAAERQHGLPDQPDRNGGDLRLISGTRIPHLPAPVRAFPSLCEGLRTSVTRGSTNSNRYTAGPANPVLAPRPAR